MSTPSTALPRHREERPIMLLDRIAGTCLGLVRLGPLLILVAICIAFSLSSPYFLTVGNFANIGLASSIVALLAIGQLFVIITAGIDLSIGSLIALTSICGALWIRSYGLGLGWLMIPTMILVGIGAGLVNGLLFVKGRIPHPFLPTLGMLMAAQGVALVLSGGTPIDGMPGVVVFFGSGHVGPVPAAVLLVAVAAVIAFIALNKLTWGQWVKAIGGNRESAVRVGVPVSAVLISVYAVSGFFASIAAIVVSGQSNSAYPTAGVNQEMYAIAAVIIGGASFFGGRGTIVGTIVGAVILGVIQNGLNLLNVDSDWQYIALGVIVVIAVELDVIRVSLEKRVRVARAIASEAH
jgi:ribose transport system permease protein